MNFENFALAAPLLRAVSEQGYKTAFPVQEQAIPIILQGRDLLASAETGTGKTGAFALPLLHRLLEKPKAKAHHTLALILTPTRELAEQVYRALTEYSQYTQLRTAVVYGGVSFHPQRRKLAGGVEILVATPGRLLDLYKQKVIRFEQIQTLVLDEADCMLDMGFIHDIKHIISLSPRSRQTLLFSATFSNGIRKLAKELLLNPVEIAVGIRNITATAVTQIVHPVDKINKTALLCHLIKKENWSQTLVFSRTKHGANKLVEGLASANLRALAIHGNKTQPQRSKALKDFKAGKVAILVATDVAARGLDIAQLPLVVNFDLPHAAYDYVHRIGRTGRAGNQGLAISLVCAEELRQLQGIEKVINRRLQRIEIPNFEPNTTSFSDTQRRFNVVKKNNNQKTKSFSPKRTKPFGGPKGDKPFGGPGAKSFGGPKGDKPFGGPGAKSFGGPKGAKSFGGSKGAKSFGGPKGDKPFGGPKGAKPFGGPGAKPFGGPGAKSFGGPKGAKSFGGSKGDKPFGGPGAKPFGGPGAKSFGGPKGDKPFGGPGAKPFGGPKGAKSFGGPKGDKPFGGPGAKPFGGPKGAKSFGGPKGDKPFGGPKGAKPFGGPKGAKPFGGPKGAKPFGSKELNPLAQRN